MYVLLASHKQVNLYTTLDNKAKGASHLRGNYDAVFMVVKYTLISMLNLSLIKFARRFANWLEVFPQFGKPIVNKKSFSYFLGLELPLNFSITLFMNELG